VGCVEWGVHVGERGTSGYDPFAQEKSRWEQVGQLRGDGAIILWNLRSGEQLRTLVRDRPYEHLNITGIRGLTEEQKVTLHTLGAIESFPASGLASSSVIGDA
jgi:hypothetical protein